MINVVKWQAELQKWEVVDMELLVARSLLLEQGGGEIKENYE